MWNRRKRIRKILRLIATDYTYGGSLKFVRLAREWDEQTGMPRCS